MSKRKRESAQAPVVSPTVLPTDVTDLASGIMAPMPKRRASTRTVSRRETANVDTNPDTNSSIGDGAEALRASPDAMENASGKKPVRKGATKKAAASKPTMKREKQEIALNEIPPNDPAGVEPKPSKAKTVTPKKEAAESMDPEADMEEDADPEELMAALAKPPPVNSSYLPLPWKGRIGYACLNTYLRTANPPVFSSRTCRIASILEHRHPLKDPSQPEHATKNRPDKDQPADIARGQAYVEALGVANARDIAKMLRWNHRFGIKFFRLSSEMFPFASHDVYGYKLAPFASEALAEAGRVAAELGHRLTTHPGQFTQLGSPRPEVITAAIRDLEYHCELLDLLKLPEQENRDAVMILHMGGVFGDKAATIERFRHNYNKLPQGIKNRLVLENDDVCYTVHDLLPVCEELNIPLVLDYHHHNILFDADKIREGTLDIMSLYPRIKATWDRKQITQKMHYSEPTPPAITDRQRRKHSPRVATLPPCADTMDLMIEAKDKEQAVFELMRTFKLPGFETFSNILPYVRGDENKAWKPPKPKKTPKKKRAIDADFETIEEQDEEEPQPPPPVPEEEVSMGGPEGRVYWPPGMEEWLRPKKREVKARDPEKAKTTAEKAAAKRAEKAAWQAAREMSAGATAESTANSDIGESPALDMEKTKSVYEKAKGSDSSKSKNKPARAPAPKAAKKPSTTKKSAVLTPSSSDHEEMEEESDLDMSDLTDADEILEKHKLDSTRNKAERTTSARSVKRKAVSYAEVDEEDS